jgi:hypothetical protein
MHASRLLTAAACSLLLAAGAWAQPAGGPAPPPLQSPSVSTQAPVRPAPARLNPSANVEASPTWAELTTAQQQALAPLTGTWKSLNQAHKRKWLALSANYGTLPPAEQALMHSRMREWALLSPQQRTQARLNFAESKKVAPGDKRAQWEAYQALPPEEKRKLAAGAQAAKPPPPPTAPAVQPVPQQKLARIPPKKKPDNGARLAVVPPGQVDKNTLLPHPGAVPVAP